MSYLFQTQDRNSIYSSITQPCRHTISGKLGSSVPVAVRRALGGSGLGSLSSEDLSSISSCHSNIDNIAPPSMLEDLDMENSMIRVASISSEVAAQVAGSGNYDDVSLLTSEAIREIVGPAVRAVETFDLPSLIVDNYSVSRQLESVSAPTMMEDLTLTQGTVTLKPAPNAPTYILHDEADTIIGVTDKTLVCSFDLLNALVIIACIILTIHTDVVTVNVLIEMTVSRLLHHFLIISQAHCLIMMRKVIIVNFICCRHLLQKKSCCDDVIRENVRYRLDILCVSTICYFVQ